MKSSSLFRPIPSLTTSSETSMGSRRAHRSVRESRALLAQLDARAVGGIDPHSYAGRPLDYAREVLGIATLTEPQQQFITLLHEPPYRVLCSSGHAVGKTFGAAVAVNYWYDSYPQSVVITTAPTQRDVVDLLWTEVRLQRQRALVPLGMDFVGPR